MKSGAADLWCRVTVTVNYTVAARSGRNEATLATSIVVELEAPMRGIYRWKVRRGYIRRRRLPELQVLMYILMLIEHIDR
jgi:hypothetical protein